MASKLGQHFLVNKNKIKKIVEALDLKDGETVLEIGPGHGELTEAVIKKLGNLVIKNFKIIAIEKDEKLADDLEFRIRNLEPRDQIEVIRGDALKILPKLITQLLNYPITSYKIVGNIPYYITGHLFRVIGEMDFKPSLIVLTIQKEVAERICAFQQTRGKPKMTRSMGSGSSRANRGMNLLAASVQFWAEPQIIGYISKKDFRPQPKVDSAIIKLVIKQLSNYEITQLPNYYRFIKILFKQPRKTILNNLLATGDKKPEIRNQRQEKREEAIKKLKKAGVKPGDRPQNLDLGN